MEDAQRNGRGTPQIETRERERRDKDMSERKNSCSEGGKEEADPVNEGQ